MDKAPDHAIASPVHPSVRLYLADDSYVNLIEGLYEPRKYNSIHSKLIGYERTRQYLSLV